MKTIRDQLIGLRVLIRGDHPHAGTSGVCIDVRKTAFGDRPLVRNENGDEFFVMDPKEWMPDPRYCTRCGAEKAHSRLRGMFCMRCG